MKSKVPLEIGVTGGIGSGKSLVCRIFALLDIPVYDADKRAKWLNNNDEAVITAISKQFGEESYNEKGQLNRDFIAGIVFKDPEKLGALNAIVHPAVGRDYASWVSAQTAAPYVIKEAALMFESGSAARLHKVINVSAPEQLRIQRVLRRDPFRSEDEIRSIMQKQMKETDRQKRADYNIYNDEKQMLIPQVLKLHEELLSFVNG